MTRLALLLATLTIGSGCCNLPSNLPTLLDKTSDRLDTRSAVVVTSFRSVIDEVEFTRMDVLAARETLEGIDPSNLSTADQQALSDAIGELKSTESALTLAPKIRSVPAESGRIFGEIQTSLLLVRQIVGEATDTKELINDVISLVSVPEEDAQ